MTQMVQVQNGDMVGLAKVVNDNTIMMDKKISSIEKNLKELGGCHNRYVKDSTKTIKKLCLAGILGAVGTIALAKEIDKLQKRVKRLEDQATYDEYMKDAGDDCK